MFCAYLKIINTFVKTIICASYTKLTKELKNDINLK